MAKIKGTNGADTLNGTALDDKIKGKSGADTIFGLAGDDRIEGDKGDDVIAGGDGDDAIDGGKGYDTAVFSGSFASYSIVTHDHHGHHHGHDDRVTVSGADGVDRLEDVERLQFDDGFLDVARNIFYSADATLDISAHDPLSPGNIYPGSGIPASDWAVVRDLDHGIELGLQVIYRQGPSVDPTGVDWDGTVNFTVADGPQSTANGSSSNNAARAAWSFEYSVSTALGGSADTLADYDLRLLIDLDPGAGTSFLELAFQPTGGLPDAPGEPRSNGVWTLAAPMAGVPGGVGTALIADDGGTDQVTQNSQNYAFYSSIIDFDGNPATDDPAPYLFTPGVFDIYLQAYDASGHHLLAENHIEVTVA